MNMNLTLAAVILGAALLPVGAQAQRNITVTAWGGAYSRVQTEAIYRPFSEKTGIKVTPEDYNGGLAEIEAQVRTGNVKWDVVNAEVFDAVKGCEEGLFERIDLKSLPAGADGTPAEKDFTTGSMSPCGVVSELYSNVIAYDAARLKENGPKTLEDFFDVKRFPGKRALRKAPGVALEWALMADGVAPADVYKVLRTAAGQARAFKKLDTIKADLVWWTAGAQPAQLLASGEVVMTSVYNGRIYDANQQDKRNFALVWDGQVQVAEGWVIPKNGKNTKAALEFVKYATSTQPLAEQAKKIPYAPPRASSLLKVDGPTKQWLPNLPRPGRSIVTDAEFWNEQGDDLNKRFAAWLAK